MRNVGRRGEEGFTLVELLVVIVLIGIIGAATLSVIVATSRSNAYGEHLRQVMDDGRLSIDRIRKELRGGRRVLEDSTAQYLHWWVDQNQNGLQEASEKVNYCVTALGSTSCLPAGQTGKFQLIRWTDADPTKSDARVIAKTLTTTDGIFTGYETDKSRTRVVTVTLSLDVRGSSGPDAMTMSAAIRLRNVA